ncbi:MAG TPA: hypothetical protein VH062_32620 [Polyangiaceae bacterium]|jgi:hypothetical protein|nr:hypothetical protein [Polyangiaceae bacterium]
MKTSPASSFLCAVFLCASGCSDSNTGAATEPPEGGTTDAGSPVTVPDAGVDSGKVVTSSDASMLDGGMGSLACSTRTTLVENVTSAENLFFIDGTERLLVSGDDGVFELTKGASGSASLTKVTPTTSCKFGGMTQIGNVVFANCYDLTDSHVYAAQVADTPEFESIYDLPGVKLANGLTSDADGHLYIASTFDARILRLTVSGDAIPKVTDETDLGGLPATLAPNGIKSFQGTLYVTSGGEVWTVTPGSDGGADAKRLFAQPDYFDDLFVSDTTIYVANFGGGAVRAYGLDGSAQGATPSKLLANPSSVLPAKGRFGLGANDFVVTEKPANRVAVVHACPL